MTRESLQTLLLCIVLIAAGMASWALHLRTTPITDSTTLAALPDTLDGFRGIDVAIDADVEEMLRADANVQRAYQHPSGYVVFVYVGYYGTERGGRPEHTPDVCYPAQGWRIVESGRVGLGGSPRLLVNEIVVERGAERRLVHFWYRTRRDSGITSTLRLRLVQFWGRLVRNRGDGALVRISTPIFDDDVVGARGRLIALDRSIERELTGVWPVERIATASSVDSSAAFSHLR